MKKLLLLFVFAIGISVNAQTSTELIGKWKLVKWTQNGKEKNIISYFKTDVIAQIFLANGDFQSIISEDLKEGKWELSKDNSELNITTSSTTVKFHIDYFNGSKRVITNDKLGTFEYEKILD